MMLFGAMCVIPLALVDPAAALMLFDLELLAMVGTSGVALLRGDAHVLKQRLMTNPTIVSIRAGWSITRERPRSLLEA